VPEPSEGLASRAGAARRQDLFWSGQIGRVGSDRCRVWIRRPEDEKKSGMRLGRARVSVSLAVYPAVLFHSTFHSRVCHSACAVVPADFCWGTVFFFCRAIYCVEAGIHRIFLIHSMECYVGTP